MEAFFDAVSDEAAIGDHEVQQAETRCAPHLFEPVCRSAVEYVHLAEQAHGPVHRPVSYGYVWGVALEALEKKRPAARIVNLETSITTSEDAMPKAINYRMHPANVAALSVARIDCAVLANNHVLDWGAAGLLETLDTLAAAGIPVAGAGRSIAGAETPAMLSMPNDSRVLVFGLGGPDPGALGTSTLRPPRPEIPQEWTRHHCGISVSLADADRPVRPPWVARLGQCPCPRRTDPTQVSEDARTLIVSTDLTTCTPAVERPACRPSTVSCGEASVAAVPCCERGMKIRSQSTLAARRNPTRASAVP